MGSREIDSMHNKQRVSESLAALALRTVLHYNFKGLGALLQRFQHK
ncbi:MAG: hypothetical protein ACJAS1_006042 [Oleiphilaceae bacterium]|jgi:hypothetical protein